MTKIFGHLSGGHPTICFAPPEAAPGSAPMPAGPTPTPVITPVPVPGTPAPAAIPAGSGGSAPPTPGAPWYVGIPDENIRTLMEQKAFANPEDVAKGYYEANRYISSQSDIVVPKADAPPEMWERYYEKIGVPKTDTEYKFNYGENAPPVDPGFEGWAKKTFHELKIPGDKADTLAQKWTGFVKEHMQQQAVADTTALNALKQEWGPKWDENVAAGRQVTAALGLPQEQMERLNADIGSPAMLALFAQLGKRMGGEGAFVTGQHTGGDNLALMAPAQAKMEIDRLQGDADFQKGYLDRTHPNHKTNVDRMQMLYARAHSSR